MVAIITRLPLRLTCSAIAVQFAAAPDKFLWIVSANERRILLRRHICFVRLTRRQYRPDEDG